MLLKACCIGLSCSFASTMYCITQDAGYLHVPYRVEDIFCLLQKFVLLLRSRSSSQAEFVRCTIIMSSAIRKKVSDIAFRAETRTFDLIKRIVNDGLSGSNGINIKRMTNYIEYKARKQFAMKLFGLKIWDFESIKQHVILMKEHRAEDAASIASETLKKYSESIAVERVAQAALKASTVLNWKYDKRRKWGNIADADFKPGTYKLANNVIDFDEEWALCVEYIALHGYLCEEYGVHSSDITRLSQYAEKIFNIYPGHGGPFGCEAIAVDGLINTATKTFNEFYAMQNHREEPTDPTNRELHGEEKETAVGRVAPSKFLFLDEEGDPMELSEIEIDQDVDEASEVGFMKSRDEMSIFIDSFEARRQYSDVSSLFSPLSCVNRNWNRIMKFMEFKARREYAMEKYGAKLGDFESIKELAFKLFELTDEKAAAVASETMAMDFQSLIVEKIADAAFKTSKILNWVSDKKGRNKLPKGICIADARFKSPKSLMCYHKKKVADAFAAYTMETFGVDKVDIDFLKGYALDSFKIFADTELDEQEAIIMACQTISIEMLYDATFMALNSGLVNNQLVEPKQDKSITDGAMVDFKCVEPMSSLVFVPQQERR